MPLISVQIKTVPGRYRVEIYSESEDSITLNFIIMYVAERDFGSYICEASSVLGQDTETMVLYGQCPHRAGASTADE